MKKENTILKKAAAYFVKNRNLKYGLCCTKIDSRVYNFVQYDKICRTVILTNVDTISFADVGTIFAIKYNRRKTSK